MISGFDFAWFSSLSAECLCIFGLLGAMHIVKNCFSYIFFLPFSELSLVGLALDLVD